jgi:hypothetical protein
MSYFFCGAVITAAQKLGYTAYLIDEDHPAPRMGWLSPNGSHCISTEFGVKRAAHTQLAFEIMQEMRVDAGTGSDANLRFFHNGWIRKNGTSHYEFCYSRDAIAAVEMDIIRDRRWGEETRLDTRVDSQCHPLAIESGWESLANEVSKRLAIRN